MSNRIINSVLLTLLSKNMKGIGSGFVHKHVLKKDLFNENPIEKIELLLKSNNKNFDKALIEEEWNEAISILEYCELNEIEIISIFDSRYPQKLKQLKNCPPVIFTRGNLGVLGKPTVCIIGTRKPNENGTKIAQKVFGHYKEKEWSICNGLADGIDSLSIQDSNGYYSNVIGVLAGGLDFEKSKTLLKNTANNAGKIIESGGLLISEYIPGFKENTFSVIASCKLQAGISDGLMLIESSLNGGSKFTVATFCETTRPIAVINPIETDLNSDSFGANSIIIQDGKKGLSQFTGLNVDKIKTQTISIIRSKNDYSEFDKWLEKPKSNIAPSLFD